MDYSFFVQVSQAVQYPYSQKASSFQRKFPSALIQSLLYAITKVLQNNDNFNALNSTPIHRWDSRMTLQLLQKRCFMQHILHINLIELRFRLKFSNILFPRMNIIQNPNLFIIRFVKQPLFFQPTEYQLHCPNINQLGLDKFRSQLISSLLLMQIITYQDLIIINFQYWILTKMFKIAIEDLKYMFSLDNLFQGNSLKYLDSLGGIQELQKKLSTSLLKGRNDSREVQIEREKIFGRNLLPMKKPKQFFAFIAQVLEDYMMRILLIGSIIQIITGTLSFGISEGWVEGGSILIVLLVIVLFFAIFQSVLSKPTRNLQILSRQVEILKEGIWVLAPSEQLYVGDILKIKQGDFVDVDGLLFEGENIVVDERNTTGESQIRKNVYNKDNTNTKNDPFILSGCRVEEGNGKVLVLGVGKNSIKGSFEGKLPRNSEHRQTSVLQEKLQYFAEKIGMFGLYFSIATFLLQLGFLIHQSVTTEGLTIILFINRFVGCFLYSTTLIIFGVPSNLPLMITLIVANFIKRMLMKSVLIKKTKVLQTSALLNTFVTDVTGVLTQHMMSAVRIVTCSREFEVLNPESFSDKFKKILCKSICFNTIAQPKILPQRKSIIQDGNLMQCGLLQLAYRLGYDYREHRQKKNILKIYPFTSDFKTNSTIALIEGQKYTFTRRSSLTLFDYCTKVLNMNGEEEQLTNQHRENIEASLKNSTEHGLRTTFLAYKVGGEAQISHLENLNNLTFISLICFGNSIKEQVPEAIQNLKDAGISIRMVTGDTWNRPVRIAQQLHLLDHDFTLESGKLSVMSGMEFRQFLGQDYHNICNQQLQKLDNFKKIAQSLKILYRATPIEKLVFVKGLKELGYIVSVTGDSTSDAPAMKESHTAIALVTSTQIAKQSADVILLNNSFSSLKQMIAWGRNTIDLIRRFVQFELTVLISTMVITAAYLLFFKQKFLTIVQLLWINLIIDILAAFALIHQQPKSNKCSQLSKNIITQRLIKNITAQVVFQVLTLAILFNNGLQLLEIEPEQHYTMMYHTFVLFQLFNMINCRRPEVSQTNPFEGLFKDSVFISLFVIAMITQCFLVQYGGCFFRTVQLSLEHHCLCIIISSFSIPVSILSKLTFPDPIQSQKSLKQN